MKITCESCGAKYTIADDKVLGRKVKIRCKGCSTPIVVDGQKLGPSGAPPAGGDVKPETMVPSPSTLIPTPAEWSVNFSETDQRTLSTQQILEGYQSGQIPADVYVWRDGMADWVPLLECAELAPLLAGAPGAAAPPAEAPPPPGYGTEPAAATAPASFPAPPAEAAPALAAPEAAAAAAAPAEAEAAPAAARSGARAVAPAGARESRPTATPEPATASRAAAARVSGGRSAGAHDLFAGVETAGAENLDAPISAGTAPALPQAGSSAYNDDRPTGARNENSVLFSLDSLKVTNPAPAPKAGAQSAPDDPFGMGASSSVANIGGGNALFTLADNQRLLSAPPPPPEPPPKAASVASAVPSLAPAAMTKKTLGIVIGGVVAVLLLGVGIGVAVGGGDDKEKDEAASATAAASAAPEEKKEEKEEKAEKKEEEPAAPPAESATAKAEEKPAEEPKSTPTPPAAKPGQGSKPAPKKEEAAPVVADQPFNRGAAVSAMSAAASQAASCKKPGGPTGSGKATLTFAPSGRVTSASVTTPPFAGTAVGGCVASVFRRAKVPPFTGNPITVSKSFTIH